MRLRLQQKIDVPVFVQLRQFASLQRIPFGSQCYEWQPVGFLLHCMQWRILHLATTILLTLYIITHTHTQANQLYNKQTWLGAKAVDFHPMNLGSRPIVSHIIHW